MKLEYEIIKRNDGMYAVCEYRWLNQSVNTRQIYVDYERKKCNKYLEELRKG